MISFEQCKNVIRYYTSTMTACDSNGVSAYIQRDCVFLNKRRGELCATVSWQTKWSAVMQLIHAASRIEQVNSVPNPATCFIDGKPIDDSKAGLQLIIHRDGKIDHICIQKRYQRFCRAYFKIRRFPEFVQSYIREWLLKQPWYIPKSYSTTFIIDAIMNSQAPRAIYTQLNESVEILTSIS